MAVEIERKFLVIGKPYENLVGSEIVQGYLNRDPDKTVRIRIADRKGFITIKGRNKGAIRMEFEYEIPLVDATYMLSMCGNDFLQKMRYRVQHGNDIWEVDVFGGKSEGLVVAEIELQDEKQTVELPKWVGQEVTDDQKYYNSNLITSPYSSW